MADNLVILHVTSENWLPKDIPNALFSSITEGNDLIIFLNVV